MNSEEVGGARPQADQALVASDGAPAGLRPAGVDPSRGCQCRLCRYDVEFAEHLAFVQEDHRAFFEDLKERWEGADFDAEWHRACIGGEEYTVEFCHRYDAQRARVTRRRRDSRSKPDRAETGTGSVHESDGAGTAIAQGVDP